MGNKRRARKAEARASKLRESLAAMRKELDKSEAKLEKSEAKLEKSRAKAARWKEVAGAHRAPAEPSAPTERAAHGEPTSSDDRVPDDTWTVVQLRAEGRARGLTGLSSKTKPELLAALSGEA